MYSIMLSSYNDNFTSSFPIWILFSSLSCLFAMARTSNTIMNRSGESGYSCLVPDFSGNVFSVSPLSIMFAVGYYKYLLLCWDVFSLYPLWWEVVFFLSWMDVNFVKCFFWIYWADHVVLSFLLLLWCITLICIYWTTFVTLGWIQLDCGLWSFLCVFRFGLLIFCQEFLHLACNFLFW